MSTQKSTETMAPEFFIEVIENTLYKIKQVLGIKAIEYVRNNDAMHNFNVGAKIESKTREEIIHGFALKHEISIRDIRQDISEGKLPSKAIVEEKFTDLINYLILEKASILDKIQKAQKNER